MHGPRSGEDLRSLTKSVTPDKRACDTLERNPNPVSMELFINTMENLTNKILRSSYHKLYPT